MKPNPNMIQAFRDVVARYAALEKPLTHRQRVTRLYRQSLKTLADWTIDRELWNEEACKIRAEFDRHSKLEPDAAQVLQECQMDVAHALTKQLVQEAEQKLEHYTHPEPYVLNYMPGGTKFMRNSPPPLDVCFPDGIPEGEEVSPIEAINVDMTPLPAKKRVLVDFMRKRLV